MSSSTSTAIPPLYGDAQGRYRIHLLGNCGTGKSTLGSTLSALPHIPLVSLDAIYFTPRWNHLSRPISDAPSRRGSEFIAAHRALVSPMRRMPDDILRSIFVASLPRNRGAAISSDETSTLCFIVL
ncbi:hypothetical protein C8F01DRAFT_1165019 [Mycena amicta]|nr:hypothetical protein C8F01DRAFT_1165019 [Mycena amicta]